MTSLCPVKLTNRSSTHSKSHGLSKSACRTHSNNGSDVAHARNSSTHKPCTNARRTSSSKPSSPRVPLSSFSKTLKAGWGKVSNQLAGKTSHSSSSDSYATAKPITLSGSPSASGLMVPRSHALVSANLNRSLRSRMQEQGVLH